MEWQVVFELMMHPLFNILTISRAIFPLYLLQVYASNAVQVIVELSVMNANQATSSGGAIFATQSGRVEIINSTLSSNVASVSGGAVRGK